MIKQFIKASLLLSTIAIIGCAGKNPYDPYEGYNRKMYSFNTAFDKAITKPVAEGYKFAVPEPARKGFGNAFHNLNDTRVAVLDITQARPISALESIHRFVFNTTFGILGFIDLTETFGLPERHTNDFGTTLALYGWKNSNYFVIPFMGPSTPRDGLGVIADVFATPYNYAMNTYLSVGLTTASLIHLRSELLDVDAMTSRAALDPYVFQREAFLQYREQQFKDRGIIKTATKSQASSSKDYDDDLSISELAKQRNQANTTSSTDSGEMSLSELAKERNQTQNNAASAVGNSDDDEELSLSELARMRNQ